MNNYTIGFEQLGIDFGKVRNNSHTCPKCSHTRKKRTDRCMSISLKTGHYHCHHCGEKGRVDSNEWINKKQMQKPRQVQIQVTDHERQAIESAQVKQTKPFITSPLNDQGLGYLRSRGISENTAKAAKIAQKGNELVFNYYYKGAIVNAKYRDVNKKRFSQHANAPNRVLYGIDQIDPKSDIIIICEGEFDKLSFDEIGLDQCVSVSQGAPNVGTKVGSKLKCLDNCAHLLENKTTILIATDNDPNGNYLRDVLISRFGADRCHIVKYPEGCKDANDVLVKYGPKKLEQCVNSAESIPIQGVTTLDAVEAEMLRIKREGIKRGVDPKINAISDHFSFYVPYWNLYYGIPNSGKSEFVTFMMMCMAYHHGWKWAVFSPEHWPASDFYIELVEKFVGHKLAYISDEDFKIAMEFVKEHFYFVYFDAADGQNAINSTKNVIQVIKRLALTKGINGFLIDPFNQLTKSSDEPRNERTDQHLERVLGMIDRLCKTHQLSGNIVAHPRTMYKGHDELDYRCPTTYEIAGGAMWSNKAYTMTAIHRPFNMSDKANPSVTIDVQKVKSYKRVGTPAKIDMQYLPGGWYVAKDAPYEDCALFGVFETYKIQRENEIQNNIK